ncbi:MAG: hypothetical protein AAFV47_06495 [Pseudomonadota bacterium]
MEALSVLVAIISGGILVVSIPMVAFYTIWMAMHRREDAPKSWHDLWGLNSAHLIFFRIF